MTERPLVSIIVPSFNQGRFIRRTLESILSQDHRPIEVLVIDGASTDGTLDILWEFDSVPELTWISEPDSGVVEAVNKGLKRAQGGIGGIQSSDDFYLPGAISAAVQELQQDASLAFVFGDIVKVDEHGTELSRTRLAPYSLEGVLSFESWIPQPSTFFRMSLAKELGGWREEVPYAADTDLWLRMAVGHDAKKIDRLMAQRSMHGEQRDRQGQKIIRDYRRSVDSLIELEALPPRARAAARAGKILIANRYAPTSQALGMARLWSAALAYPPIFRRYPLGSFVPGWYTLRAATRSLLGRGAAAQS